LGAVKAVGLWTLKYWASDGKGEGVHAEKIKYG
jgi:hypothetical protein